MALRDRFSRKARDLKLAETVAEAVKAGLAGSPMGTSNYNRATPSEPYSTIGGQGIVTGIGQAIPMDRPGVTPNGGGFGAMLGPAAPLLPAPIDVVLDETGRALPRKYEYAVAQNLVLTQTEVPYEVLTSMAEQVDVIRRAIDIRVGDLVKQDWSFTLSESAIAEIMQDQNVSHAKAARIGRDKYGDEINRLTAFWKNPYTQSDRSWSEWLTEALNQVFIYDQLCIYPRYNLGKNLIGLDIINAPTIKLLLDNRGDIPAAPLPAYQQVLWGFPRGEFTAAPESDGDFYNTPGKYGEYLTDQMSVYVKNRRTYSPYGLSLVEQCVPAATLYLDRQAWMRAEYQFGSMPTTFMKTNSMELTLEKLSAYERILNDRLTGSTAERHRIKVLPDGFDPVAMPSQDERYKSDYDEFIIKRIAAIMGVSPSALGVVARAGLGGGKGQMEGEQQSSELTSTKPMEMYVTDIINSLSRRYLDADLNVTFVLQDSTSTQSELEQSKALQMQLFSGQKTLNDVQGELGQALYEMPEADEPFIVAGNAITFLKGLLNTDASGETSGQKETPSDGSTLSETPQGEAGQDEGEESPSASQAPETDLKAQEAKAFAKFAQKPRAREFEFKFHTPEEAAVLKAQISDTPKGLTTKAQTPAIVARRRKVSEHYAPLIHEALKAATTGVETAVRHALVASTAKASKSDKDKHDAKAAVDNNVAINTDALTNLVSGVHADGGLVGTDDAMTQLPDNEAITSSPMGALSNSVDWATWTPGNAEAASKVAGKGLRALMDSVGVTIKGISDTTSQAIGNIIADGLAQGSTYDEITSAIYNSYALSYERAQAIASTEAGRAANASTLDAYQVAGITQFNWETYDPCDECQAEGEANPHDVTDTYPPLHPNCECFITPAV